MYGAYAGYTVQSRPGQRYGLSCLPAQRTARSLSRYRPKILPAHTTRACRSSALLCRISPCLDDVYTESPDYRIPPRAYKDGGYPCPSIARRCVDYTMLAYGTGLRLHNASCIVASLPFFLPGSLLASLWSLPRATSMARSPATPPPELFASPRRAVEAGGGAAVGSSQATRTLSPGSDTTIPHPAPAPPTPPAGQQQILHRRPPPPAMQASSPCDFLGRCAPVFPSRGVQTRFAVAGVPLRGLPSLQDAPASHPGDLGWLHPDHASHAQLTAWFSCIDDTCLAHLPHKIRHGFLPRRYGGEPIRSCYDPKDVGDAYVLGDSGRTPAYVIFELDHARYPASCVERPYDVERCTTFQCQVHQRRKILAWHCREARPPGGDVEAADPPPGGP